MPPQMGSPQTGSIWGGIWVALGWHEGGIWVALGWHLRWYEGGICGGI